MQVYLTKNDLAVSMLVEGHWASEGPARLPLQTLDSKSRLQDVSAPSGLSLSPFLNIYFKKCMEDRHFLQNAFS